MKRLFIACLSILLLLFYHSVALARADKIKYRQQSISIKNQIYSVLVPSGYQLQLLNDTLVKPRILSFLPNKELLIGSKTGIIYRLNPPYINHQTLLKLNDYPHSVAWKGNQLYIAQTHGLYQIKYTPGQTLSSNTPLVLIAPLPSSGHSSRTVKLGPDNHIYLSIGISGNCSDEYLHSSYNFKHRRGGIFTLNESTAGPQLTSYASGLRNPVGFDWHPTTNIMYASNNGPDHQGFNQPPEYFSKITNGSFHGMPWFQYDGKSVIRDTCISRSPPLPAEQVSIPVATFPARNAPLAVSFVPKHAMDSRFTYDAIVALHGSWGTPDSGSYQEKHAARRPPKLVVVQFEDGNAIQVDDLITGFQLANGDRWARPAGVAFGPDNDLYFTSDSGINGLFRLTKIK